MEISREPQDLLGVGLSRCPDTKAIIIESIKQASLADRYYNYQLHLDLVLRNVNKLLFSNFESKLNYQ